VVLGLLLSTLLATIVPEVSVEPDANQIYLRAKDVVNASPIPPYIAFTFQNGTEQVLSNEPTLLEERLRVVVRTIDGHAFVQTIQLPTGYQGHLDPVVVGDNDVFPNTNVDRLGDFPLSTFGLRDGNERADFLEADSAPDPRLPRRGLRTIAVVSSRSLPYKIERLTDDRIYGRAMYHLRLSPIRDARQNVLREMWVDKETFAPCRYVAERFISSPIAFSYLVTIDNVLVGGHLVNVALTGHFSNQAIGHPGPAGMMWPRPRERRVNASWALSDISFPEALPPWLFDPDGFKLHRGDPLPIALSGIGVPPTLPSLRRLVFEYAIDTQSVPNDRAPDDVCKSAEELAQRSAAQGRIYLDVVAATDDGGLAVDVSTGPTQATPFARVAIAPNGQLTYDPRIRLTTAEATLLRLLGRNVIGPTVRRAGDLWKVPGGSSNIELRMLDVTSPQSELICLRSGTAISSQTNGIAMQGTVGYDPALSVPTYAHIVRTETNGAPSNSNTRTTIDFTLLADSFSASAPQ